MARSIGSKSKKWNKLDRHHRSDTTINALGEHLAITKGMDRVECRGLTKEVMGCCAKDDVWPACIIQNTSHRDGSLYRRNQGFLTMYRITDRRETQWEPMALSERKNCLPNRENCIWHTPTPMMQIFSLKLAKIPIDTASIQLYGYIAVRDGQDSLLNYIVNRSRDEAMLMQQGSLIEMTGPKRGISMFGCVLIEFDMRIKNGDQEEDDLQLIDGIIDYSDLTTPCKSFTTRISGDHGAVDITLGHIFSAVEATIEVVISEVQHGFHLSLSSFVSVNELDEQETRLFHGHVGESCGLRRYVVAVLKDTCMHLKFNLGKDNDLKNDVEHYVSFEADIHGCVSEQVMLDFASISVKVTWSTLPLFTV